MKRPTQQDQPRSLMARGIDALSRREYSRKELREKLVQALEAGQSASEVDAVLDELESKKYLSNERYARSRVRMRSARYGNRRLAYELAMKGIDAEEVQEALQEAGDEFERAWAVWSRRYGNPPEDYKEKTRQARFLAARGFGFDMIERVLTKLVKKLAKTRMTNPPSNQRNLPSESPRVARASRNFDRSIYHSKTQSQ